MSNLNLIKIIYPFSTTWLDYPDNENLAVLVFFLGCSHDCIDCQNPEFQNPDYHEEGKVIYLTDEPKYMESFYECLKQDCKRNRTNKVVFSGGDPLFDNNLTFVKKFLLTYHAEFDICVYTGFESEYVIQYELKGFKFIKCGRYNYKCKQLPEKTNSYIKLASTNQKLYDCEMNLLSDDGTYYFK